MTTLRCQSAFSLCEADLWSDSTSLSKRSDYCADCCGASDSAGSRKLSAQADQHFSHSLLKMRIAATTRDGVDVEEFGELPLLL